MCRIGTRVIEEPGSRPVQQNQFFIKPQALSEEPLTGSFTELYEDRCRSASQHAAKIAGREDAKKMKDMRQSDTPEVGRIMVGQNVR
jgi:hypothetical protein